MTVVQYAFSDNITEGTFVWQVPGSDAPATPRIQQEHTHFVGHGPYTDGAGRVLGTSLGEALSAVFGPDVLVDLSPKILTGHEVLAMWWPL